MDICFQVVLFQTEKKASIKLIIIYYIFVSFVMFIWIPILFIFNVFFVFFSLFFFLHLFADNVGVWAFLTLHWMWFFLSIYNLQYRGSSQFFQCSCLLIEVLTVCVCTHTCVEVLCVHVCLWACVCVNEYLCAPLCLGTPTLPRCRGVQDQQIV